MMAKLLCCALLALLLTVAAHGFRISESDNEITGPFNEVSSESSEISSREEVISDSREEDAEVWFKCPLPNGLFRNPRNCSSFVQCSNGRPVVMPCPKGLHYSEDTKRCEQPCEAYCNQTLSCKCEWKTCGLPRICFLPKETGPCYASIPRWFFNRRTGVCEEFTYGGCRGNKNNFETKEACEKSCSKSEHHESDDISAADEQVEAIYKCIHDGLYRNPRNCSTFIQCSNGKPYVMPCPKGLNYNAETKRCDEPCKAYCNRTLSCECKWPTCGLPETCFLPKVVGPCLASIPRYFFNKRTGVCEKFFYGGCGGNKNNYVTKEECEKGCSKKSSASQESSEISSHENEEESAKVWFKCPIPNGLFRNPRNCSSFFQCSNNKPVVMLCPKGLHYSEDTKRCEQPCEAYCNRTLSCKCEWKTCGLDRVCFLPKVTGPCRANMPRWFFNRRTGVCEKFVYGGCSGNKNNFETKEACEKKCSKSSYSEEDEISEADEQVESRFECHQDGLYANPKNCSTFVQCSNGLAYVMPCPKELHYSVVTKRCERKCEAYCNSTLSCECKWPTCGLPETCFLPKEVGHCLARDPRWFFNKRTGKCEQFIYGGCGGNKNNYVTKEACEKGCSKVDPETCNLPKEVGPCKASIPRYYYDKSTGKCEKFVYGGCKGNSNNFETKEECEKRCAKLESDTCSLPKEVGPCRASIPRYFYDKSTGKCEKFVYGGCKGNSNNFLTKEACEKRCVKGEYSVSEEESSEVYNSQEDEEDAQVWFKCPTQNGLFRNPRNCSSFIQCSNGKPNVMPCPKGLNYNAETKRCDEPCKAYCNRTLSCKCEWKTCGLPRECFLPKETGPCRANVPRWFFNKRTGVCEKFVYGGCKGNKNNFETKEACEKRCSKSSHSEDDEISEADERVEVRYKCPQDGLYPNPRNCSTFIQCSNGKPYVMPCPKELHYSAETKRCERKCEAYCNRTLSCECKWPTCGLPATCFLPKSTGPCQASKQRYFFNKRTGKCEQFVYGGCRGNSNNFETKEACEKKCSKDVPVVCQLPRDVGPCKAIVPAWYYNKESGQCEKFTYGGCKGNENRFGTKEECEKKCIVKSEESMSEESSEVYDSQEDEEMAEVWFQCPHKSGLYPNPRNCSSFIQCSNGKPIVMPCPKGLHFSDETKRCEEPCKAYCNRTLSCKCDWKTCGLPRECFLNKETGPCRASMPRWFFNKRTGVCEKFVYGGCKGNKNNFETKEACEKRCSKSGHSAEEEISAADEQLEVRFKCIHDGLYRNPRNCSTFIQCSNDKAYVMPCPKGLHYNAETKQCAQKCEAYCNRTLSCECKWPTCGLPRVCFLPKMTGPCKASMQRYFFNKRSGQCEQFIYGGCGGNLNNFETKEACEKRCSKSTHEEDISVADEELEATFKCYKDGLFLNPRNCSSYIQCSNKTPYVMPCPKGLNYDAKTKRCQEPCKAYCNKTLSCQCKWPTCGLPDLCFLPAKTGPCRAGFHRFFFNKRTGKCEKFIYGGCRGNSNNFETKEACEKICKKITTSEESSHEEFSVSEEEVEVKPFLCPENEGLFRNPRNCSSFIQCSNGKPNVMPCPKGLNFNAETKRCDEPCKAYCNQTLSCKCEWATCGLPRVCFLPKVVGPCRASMRRWFFNKRTGVCEKFFYGGCSGNANNFQTKEACEKRCSKKSGDEVVEQFVNVCRLPKDHGPCDAKIDRFYFDYTQGQCKPFVYGGCGGNANRFRTKKQCEDRCLMHQYETEDAEEDALVDVCQLPKEKGPCNGYFRRFYFDSAEGKCKAFIYGGCQGNGNNFQTSQLCKIRCSGGESESEYAEEDALVDVCQLPKDKGPCKGNIKRYYFDSAEGKCKAFIYGGCQGNGNNFANSRQCENRCRRGQSGEPVPSISSSEEEIAFWCPTENGDFSHPSQPERFIRCRDNRPQVYRCPPSMTFSEAHRACVNQEESSEQYSV